MKVALVAGLCVRHDAISTAAMLEREVLRDAGHEVKVFTQFTNLLEVPEVLVTADAWTMVRDPFYAAADLVVLHFGIGYRLFDSLLIDHPRARRVVRFHNVTPPQLLTGPARAAALAGLDQISIADRADRVWSDSAHNTEVLLDNSDVSAELVRLLPLCVPMVGVDSPKPGAGTRVRIQAVGRLVPAKGLHDLVRAFAQLQCRESELVLVGATGHSERDYICHLRELVGELGVGGRVRFLHDLTDAELHESYASTDVFVSPSHHEGFCVPVLEALANGCEVVVTDAGALPDTVGDHGAVVPTADPAAMARALDDSIRAVEAGGPDGRRRRIERRREYLSTYELEGFRRNLLAAVEDVVPDPERWTQTAGLAIEEFRRRFEAGDLSLDRPAEGAIRSVDLVDHALEPHSTAYADRVMSDWSRITGRSDYRPDIDERFNLDEEVHLARPWPYVSGNAREVANYLGAVARTLTLLPDPPGRIVEYGSGWGHMALTLAMTGYEVTAVDLNEESVALLRRRAAALQTELHVVRAEFLDYVPEQPVDAIVFFEAFHHCERPFELLDNCVAALAHGGRLIFVAEALYERYYAPWGIRPDGGAALMSAAEGWLELGFDLDFFREELSKRGLSSFFQTDSALGAHGTFLVATTD